MLRIIGAKFIFIFTLSALTQNGQAQENTIEQIIKLHKGGISTEIMLAFLNKAPVDFTDADVVKLSSASVPNEVVIAVQKRLAPTPPSVANAPSTTNWLPADLRDFLIAQGLTGEANGLPVKIAEDAQKVKEIRERAVEPLKSYLNDLKSFYDSRSETQKQIDEYQKKIEEVAQAAFVGALFRRGNALQKSASLMQTIFNNAPVSDKWKLERTLNEHFCEAVPQLYEQFAKIMDATMTRSQKEVPENLAELQLIVIGTDVCIEGRAPKEHSGDIFLNVKCFRIPNDKNAIKDNMFAAAMLRGMGVEAATDEKILEEVKLGVAAKERVEKVHQELYFLLQNVNPGSRFVVHVMDGRMPLQRITAGISTAATRTSQIELAGLDEIKKKAIQAAEDENRKAIEAKKAEEDAKKAHAEKLQGLRSEAAGLVQKSGTNRMQRRYGLCLENELKALDIYESLLSEFKNDGQFKTQFATALNQTSWDLMTSADVSLRNPVRALPLARRAVELTGEQDSNFLDTLALACFRNGNKQEAVEIQRKALGLIPSWNRLTRSKFEARLKEYEAGAK